MKIARLWSLVCGTVILGVSGCGNLANLGANSADSGASPTKGTGPNSGTSDDSNTIDPDKKIGPDDAPSDTSKGLEPRTPCAQPATFKGTFNSVANIVKLLNAMPKPVTIPCLVDVLPRPLKLSITDSNLSVQPAEGGENPRIFISIDPMIMTFAMTGDGSKTVEFSELLGSDRSVKAEIGFPVTDSLAESAPFDRIKLDKGNGSKCVGCHFNELSSGSSYPATAYTSKALRPFSHQLISVETLKGLADLCGEKDDLRCQLLNAIFRGEPAPGTFEFPEDMPTLF